MEVAGVMVHVSIKAFVPGLAFPSCGCTQPVTAGIQVIACIRSFVLAAFRFIVVSFELDDALVLRTWPEVLNSYNLSDPSVLCFAPFTCDLQNPLRLTGIDQLKTSSLPDSIGQLTALQTLRLSGRGLSGPIPASLGYLTNLTELQIQENQLTGQLPMLTNLTKLTYIDIGTNILTGAISKNLQLVNLRLCFSGNFGSIIECLTSQTVFFIKLNDNQFTGNIPHSIGNLTSLEYMWLQQNYLTGLIPSTLNQLSDLIELRLEFNFFEGLIPALDLTSLSRLQLGGNLFSGELPNLSALRNLRSIYLFSNWLSGRVPEWLGSLPLLREINLVSNNFSGHIPDSLCALSFLSFLGLSSNRLTGSVPACLVFSSEIGQLKLDRNMLTGVLHFF